MNLPSFLSKEEAVKEFVAIASSIGTPVGIKTSTENQCAEMAGSDNQGYKAVGESLAMECTIGKSCEPVTISCCLLDRD